MHIGFWKMVLALPVARRPGMPAAARSLEATACECYPIDRRRLERLL
jgi:hypothetical protein